MVLRKISKNLLVLTLSISLANLQCAFGTSSPRSSKEEQIETCRKLLESISNPAEPIHFPTDRATAPTGRTLDLRATSLDQLESALSTARVEDVLLIDEQRLTEVGFVTALAKSKPLFSVATSRVSISVDKLLHAPVGRPEILVAIPTSAPGVEQVFGIPDQTSGSAVRYMTEASEKFRSLKNTHVLNYSTNGRSLADELLVRAKRRIQEPLIVVAHNVRGTLKLPDGSSIQIDDLYKALGDRLGVVLSCDTIHSSTVPSNVLLTNRRLDFKDIAKGLWAAQQQLTKNPALSLQEFMVKFGESLPIGPKDSQGAVKLIAVSVGGLIVVAMALFWICDDNDTALPFCISHPKGSQPGSRSMNGTSAR